MGHSMEGSSKICTMYFIDCWRIFVILEILSMRGCVPTYLFNRVRYSTVQLRPGGSPACGVHPRGDIDGVAPDVVVQLGRANDAAGDVAKVETDTQDEIELDEGLIEVLHHALQAKQAISQWEGLC